MPIAAEKSFLELLREHDERVLTETAKAAREFDNRIGKKAKWPMESLALACHPDQIAEFRQHAHQNGLTGIDFKTDGTCVISDQGQRREYSRLRGVFDRNAGYGDAAPNNVR